jgi:hypothetical protein
MSTVDDAIDMQDYLEEEDTQKDKYLTFIIDKEF